MEDGLMNKQHGTIYYIHTFLCIIFLNCIFIFNFSLLHDSHGSHSGSHDSLACTLGRPQFSSSCIPLSTLLIFNPTFHKNSQLGGQIIQFSFATYFNIIPKVTLPLCPLFNHCAMINQLHLPIMNKSWPVLVISRDRRRILVT